MSNVGTRGRRLVISALVYLMLASPAMKPISDPDIWWHLRTGQWILEHGQLPTQDPFATYSADKTWVPYSWLFDVLIYNLYLHWSLSGLLAFRVAMALCIAFAVSALVRRFQMSFPMQTVLLAVIFLTMAPLMTPRSWLFSIFFFAVELNIISCVRRSGNVHALLLLPPIFVLWANLHIQFVYGLAVLVLFVAEVVWNSRTSRLQHHDLPSMRVGYLVLIAIACAFAIFVTPYHFRILLPLLQVISETGVYQTIRELQPMHFRSVSDWAVLLLAIAATYILGWQRNRVSFPMMFLLMAAFLGFRSQRDTWVLVFASAIVISEHPVLVMSANSLKRTTWEAFMVGLAVATSLYFLAQYRQISEPSLEAVVRRYFPAEAVRFIKANQYPGPLFNSLDWGGYLMWSLPNILVAVDGRTNLHNDARLTRLFGTWQGYPGWQSDPELSQARLIVADLERPLTSLLRLDRRFRLVHEDSTAAVFVARE